MKTKCLTLTALITTLVISMLVSACELSANTGAPKYVVRVEDKAANQAIYNAKVIVEMTDIGKISDVTDTDGYVRLSIPANYVNKPARLIVEAEGYEAQRSEITLSVDQPPTRILLEKKGAIVNQPAVLITHTLVSDTSATPKRTFTPDPNTSAPVAPAVTPVSATPTPVELPRKIIDAKGVEMALIPAGPFQMGSDRANLDERPRRTATLSAFYMDLTEVSNAIYELCVQASQCTRPVRFRSTTRQLYYPSQAFTNYPVIHVNWQQAVDFCEWRGARLLTEAEWEKAALGELVGAPYSWGDQDPLCSQANFDGCEGDTLPVTSHAPNGYGLFNMVGNVREWVADWYGDNYYANAPTENPAGPANGVYRSVRGGSFLTTPFLLRLTDRDHFVPDVIMADIGFRCARTP